jgi:transposase-like protein
MDELFKGRHFDREIIVLCVRWYLRYRNSASSEVCNRTVCQRDRQVDDPAAHFHLLAL